MAIDRYVGQVPLSQIISTEDTMRVRSIYYLGNPFVAIMPKRVGDTEYTLLWRTPYEVDLVFDDLRRFVTDSVQGLHADVGDCILTYSYANLYGRAEIIMPYPYVGELQEQLIQEKSDQNVGPEILILRHPSFSASWSRSGNPIHNRITVTSTAPLLTPISDLLSETGRFVLFEENREEIEMALRNLLLEEGYVFLS